MAYDFAKIISVEGRLCVIDSGFDKLNQGSLVEALFLREEDIISSPSYSFAFDELSAAQLSGTLLLKSGAEGYRFRFTPETGGFGETSTETDIGVYYNQSFTIQIPKDRPEITWLKHRMRRPRYAIIYRDANGIVKFLRNQRVKFDFNTQNNRSGYNGHTLQARRSVETPALHWDIQMGESLESLYTAASLTLSTTFFNLPEGWQAGKVLQLNTPVFSADATLLIYNQSLRLRYGEHYIIEGTNITLLFSDEVASGDPGTIHMLNATNTVGDDIGGFQQSTATRTAAYNVGETFTLPAAPLSINHLRVVWNSSLTLRPGIDYTLAGNLVTLSFAADPDGDTDSFDFFFATAGPALDITGWKQYPVSNTLLLEIASGVSFPLPHTPISASLLLHLDDTIQLRPGVDYNLNNDEIEILFALPAGSRIDAWYAY